VENTKRNIEFQRQLGLNKGTTSERLFLIFVHRIVS